MADINAAQEKKIHDDSDSVLEDDAELQGISEKTLLRKLDLRLLPPLALLYLLSFLDRSNGKKINLSGLALANQPLYSGQCAPRWFNDRLEDNWEPVSDGIDVLLHRLRSI
jgi:hypothetical protein